MSENTLLADIPANDPLSETSTPAPIQNTNVQSDVPSWLNGVDPEIARDPSLKVFNNHQDLIKSYVHAQKMLGKDKTVLPGKNSSDVEWKQFYQKLGVPDQLNDYQVVKNDKYVVNEDVLSDFRKVAHDSNLLPSQAQKVMDWFNEKASAGMENNSKIQEDRITQGWEALNKEWGAGFDKNMHSAKAVIKEFGDQGFVDYLNESGLGDDPKLARFLSNIGKNLREDSFQEAVAERHSMSPAEAKAAYTRIVSDANSSYRNEQHPEHKQAVADMAKLFQLM